MAYTWLPELLEQDNFETDQEWIDAAYDVFKKDFLDTIQTFQAKNIGAKRLPMYDGLYEGKNGTFRHLMTTGNNEQERETVWERVSRVGWPRPMIERKGTHELRVWQNKRKSSGVSWVIALADFSYKVVLVPRRNSETGEQYFLLWTAYPMTFKNDRMKLKKEYERYNQAQKN